MHTHDHYKKKSIDKLKVAGNSIEERIKVYLQDQLENLTQLLAEAKLDPEAKKGAEALLAQHAASIDEIAHTLVHNTFTPPVKA